MRAGTAPDDGTRRLSPDRPRTIVVIIADDLGYGDPGCFNRASKVPTPALDRLAREGLRLTHARAPSALCTPSRYALLTGCAHWRTGARRPLVDPYGPPILDPATPTIASVLREAGYRTAFVGKWHLGLRYPSSSGRGWAGSEQEIDFAGRLDGGPPTVGFDRFFGTAGCSTSDPPYAFIAADRFSEMPTLTTPASLTSLPGVMPGLMVPGWDIRRVDEILVEAAVDVLGEHAEDPDGPPLFLLLALSAPHNPWEPPEHLEGISGDGPRGDMAAAFDVCVGRVLEALDAMDLDGDTLLLVTSDHGPQYERGAAGHRPTGPFRGRKNTVWEGGLRVPAWLRWPGRVVAGSTSATPMVHSDLLPTLAEIAAPQLPPPAARDGISQASAWFGGPPVRRGPTLLECGGALRRIGGWAVLDGDWKLVVTYGDDGREELRGLFELGRDPGETSDRSEEQPRVASRLLAFLHDTLGAAGWPSPSDPLAPPPRA